jgi:predicted methyltransferase
MKNLRAAALAAAVSIACVAMLTSACEFKSDAGPSQDTPPPAAAPAAPPEDATLAIKAAIANPARLADDRAQDEWRKPLAVLSFLQVKSGMRVLDVFAGGGYYTELLSYAVADGAVLAYNNKAYADYAAKELDAHFTGGRLPNVKRIEVQAGDLKLVPGELDAAIFIRSYHDVYWHPKEGWSPVDGGRLLKEVFNGLKPGGVVVVQDHVAAPGGDPQDVVGNLHRIDPDVLKRDFLGAGFVLDAESDAFHNPADDHSLLVFDAKIRYHTDDMLLRFRKPLPAASENASGTPE